ncbi:SNF2-related protein [Clostridium paraputrificum]|uniref:DEAD/DEAH box helicase n=1 Tax=Clostridium paraputrificum TaxID=29363 RepID=UPI0006C304F7|nr:DEAD/DEAH box helicase [Clostridium paraputrificum]CUP99032.1 SNF2-related protein [Clostridium paraputrificum]
MNITLDINSNCFVLGGDIDYLKKNRRHMMFLKNAFSLRVNENTIDILFEEETKEEYLTKLKRYFDKNNISSIKSKRICDELEEYFSEEEKFEVFSEQAYKIRNNICDVQEFDYFTKMLDKYLVNRKLYPLQLLSAYHLSFSQNSCNFSVPGAGKTSIVYGAYSYLSNLDDTSSKKVNALVIVGPLSSFGPWENEFFECFGRKPSVMRLSGGTNKNERIRYLKSSRIADITLISYQGLLSIKDELAFFMRQNKVMLVLDEAHKIKNTDDGRIATSALEIAKYAKSRVALTGTPAPNGYEDLYNIFKFIWPQKNVMKFRLHQLKDMSKNKNDVRVNTLISNIEPFYIRIGKRDLKLPEAKELDPIIIPMGNLQKEIYQFIEKNYMDYLIEVNRNKSGLKEYFNKARIIRLMQAATNPHLLQKPIEKNILDENEFSDNFIDDLDIITKICEYALNEIPAKFNVALRIILEKIQNGEKVIVWSTFVENIKSFSSFLMNNNIDNRMLYGETPSAQNCEDDDNDEFTRESIIRQFNQKESSFKVIIANPFAVAESISLHKVCHTAIYMDRNFNAAQFLQSKDRIHRYGLDKNICTEYYYLVSQDSIDCTIDDRLREKIKRLELIIDTNKIPLFDNVDDEMGNEDIKAIIKDYVARTKQI